jgi:hypothetical protein
MTLDQLYAQNHEHDAGSQATALGAGRPKEEIDEALARYTWWLMAFTAALAIATIGLGGATYGLYRTGEKQLRFLRESSAAQSRDMQASVAAAQKGADAALLSAQTSKAAIIGRIAINNYTGTWSGTPTHPEGYSIVANIENVGASHAINCKIFTAAQLIDIGVDDFKFEVPNIRPRFGLASPGTKLVPADPRGLRISDAVRVWMGEVKFLYYAASIISIFTESLITLNVA